jgi:hypothetical protein
MTTEADSARDDLVVVQGASDAALTAGLKGGAINAIRLLAIDAIEGAKSGHPGTPMGFAPLAYRLFTRHLRHDPAHPDWPDRDRFVLSGGHGSMLPCATLHLSGYDLSIEDLKQFRRWGSRTPFRAHGDAGRRNPRSGVREHRRDHDRRADAGGAVQPTRSRDRRAPHLRGPRRRRHHGGISSEATSLAARLHLGLGKLTASRELWVGSEVLEHRAFEIGVAGPDL